MATDTKYIEGIGRRKTASARVRITPAKEQSITVNEKSLSDYFENETMEKTVLSVFETEGVQKGYAVSVKVSGSGLSAQADAVRLGIARALVKEDGDMRGALKKEGFLMRDPRSVERKKFGLRKSRKRPQWSKR